MNQRLDASQSHEIEGMTEWGVERTTDEEIDERTPVWRIEKLTDEMTTKSKTVSLIVWWQRQWRDEESKLKEEVQVR